MSHNIKQNTANTPETSNSNSGVLVFIGLGVLVFFTVTTGSLEFGVTCGVVFWVCCIFVKDGMKKLAVKSSTLAVSQTKKLYDTYTTKDGIAEPNTPIINTHENTEGYPSTKIIDQERTELPRPLTGQVTDGVITSSVEALPGIVRYGDIVKSKPDSKTTFPLGVDTQGQMLWGDFQGDNVHMGVWGATRFGKDTLLRSIFYTLTSTNTAKDVQFAVLDDKGDWMLPNLRNLSHMFFNPVGGLGEEGKKSIEQGAKAVYDEMARRFALVQEAGYRTREAYIAGTGDYFPLLIVIITDVSEGIEDTIDTLLTDLVRKSAAAGMRVIVSTQTPGNMSMSWRSNIGTNVSFYQPDSSQDAVCLGVRKVTDLPIRPSQIPPTKASRGVFTLRSTQLHLVRGVFIDEDFFDQYVNALPRTPRTTYTGEETADSITYLALVEEWYTDDPGISGREVARRLYAVQRESRGEGVDQEYDGSGPLFYTARELLEQVKGR